MMPSPEKICIWFSRLLKIKTPHKQLTQNPNILNGGYSFPPLPNGLYGEASPTHFIFHPPFSLFLKSVQPYFNSRHAAAQSWIELGKSNPPSEFTG